MRIMNSMNRSESHRRPSPRHAPQALAVILPILAILALVALAGCGQNAGATTESVAPTLTPLPAAALSTPTPNPKTAAQQTVIQFCQALSDSQLAQAFALLTSGYQQRARSASNLPNVLEANWGPATGCSEFGEGNFIQVSGNHASDSVQFTVNTRAFGTKQINSTLNLALVGSAWRLDSNT